MRLVPRPTDKPQNIHIIDGHCFAQTMRLDYRVAELKRQQDFICDYRFIQVSLSGLQLSMTSVRTFFDGTEK